MRPTPAITRAPRSRGRKPIGLKVALALLAVILLACVSLSFYVGWKLTHPARNAVSDSPQRLGMTYEDITFKSRHDGLNLKGWFIPGQASKEDITTIKPKIIMAHGYRSNRLSKNNQALLLAQALTERGYDVLMFDFRASGESEGSLSSIGLYEKNDLLGAIDWMQAKHPGNIGLLGFSMGASTALMAAAEEKSVSGVVADSPFNHLGRYLDQNLPVWSHLPAVPFTPLIMGMLPPVLGIDPNAVDGMQAVENIYPRPILFIHSTNDHSIPYENSESMRAMHPDVFQLWKTSNEGHAESYLHYSDEYVQRITAFFEKL